MSNVVQFENSGARILRVSEAEYHADPCAVPSLSQSIAKTLITKSPLHAWAEHPRLGNLPKPQTKAKDDGTIIHAIMLGSGADLDVIKADNFKKKAAQELRDAAYEAGRTPVLERRYAELITAAGAIRKNLEECGIVLDGQSEVALEWRESGFDGDVVCRGKPDHLVFDLGRAVDLKKISSADEETCRRHAYEYGYDIQGAAYTSALSKLLPHFAGRVDFVLAFFEIEPPYAVNPFRLTGTHRALGESKWNRAVTIWERCLRENDWPGYSRTIGQLEAAPWALAREEMINASI